jgi:hypothetical protein
MLSLESTELKEYTDSSFWCIIIRELQVKWAEV